MSADPHSAAPVIIGQPLSLHDTQRISQGLCEVQLDQDRQAKLQQTRDALDRALQNKQTIYGVNTGFGALSEERIDADSIAQLQVNLLRSHAIGVGEDLNAQQVRALLALRAHTLCLGASGASPELAQALLSLLNAGVVPKVPRQGSVGASGDLAPLAHLALVLIGEGKAYYQQKLYSGAEALTRAGLKPYALRPKEGLSLINGTQVTTTITALALAQGFEVLCAADVLGALTLDVSLGSARICDPRIHALKAHPGQQRSAQQIQAVIENSALLESHRDCGRVQDAYSLRCMPQVHGAVRNALRYVAQMVTVEINSATDNPLLLPRDDGGFDVQSGGNFHAAAVALPADHATAACTQLATISERRCDRLMNRDSSRGLPAFLTEDAGLESGFMMVHVTASALASECKALSFPASVDTIPTSAGQEDHVSMGPIAARKFQSVVQCTAKVLAIEAACSARALDLRRSERKVDTSPRLQQVYAKIREYVAPFSGDRSMSEEIEALAAAILRGELRSAAGLEPEWPAP